MKEKLFKSFILIMAITGVTLICIGLADELYTVKVAVVDTGINASHNAFKGRKVYESNLSIIYTNTKDTNNHGSHVAGIISLNTPKNIEIHSLKNIFEIGEDSIFKLSSVKNDNLKTQEHLLNSQDIQENFLDYLSAINYAIQNNIKIINISQVTTTQISDEQLIILNNVFSWAKENGILIIAASGNERINLNILKREWIPYPCGLKLDNIICVGNIDNNKNIKSNYGNLIVDVWANGEDVVSASKEDSYIYMSGSSMAAPKITALAANIWNKHKLYNYKQIKRKLFSKLKYNSKLKEYSTQGLYLE